MGSAMYTKNEILEQLYRTQFIDNYTKTFCKANDVENLEDEIQEIYLIACQIPEERLIKMYEDNGINGVRRYMAGVICRQMNSNTSLIHSKYRKHKTNTYTTDGMTTEEIEDGYNKIYNGYFQ